MDTSNEELATIGGISDLERELNSTEADSKGVVRKVIDSYFQPKSFERSGRLYEAIGIRPFKKTVTYAGKLFLYAFNKLVGRKRFEKPDWPNNYWLWDRSVEGLKEFGVVTKISEAYHVLYEALLATVTVSEISQGDTKDALIWGTMLLANTYGIMLQRYNRARTYNIIDRIEHDKK